MPLDDVKTEIFKARFNSIAHRQGLPVKKAAAIYETRIRRAATEGAPDRRIPANFYLELWKALSDKRQVFAPGEPKSWDWDILASVLHTNRDFLTGESDDPDPPAGEPLLHYISCFYFTRKAPRTYNLTPFARGSVVLRYSFAREDGEYDWPFPRDLLPLSELRAVVGELYPRPDRQGEGAALKTFLAGRWRQVMEGNRTILGRVEDMERTTAALRRRTEALCGALGLSIDDPLRRSMLLGEIMRSEDPVGQFMMGHPAPEYWTERFRGLCSSGRLSPDDLDLQLLAMALETEAAFLLGQSEDPRMTEWQRSPIRTIQDAVCAAEGDRRRPYEVALTPEVFDRLKGLAAELGVPAEKFLGGFLKGMLRQAAENARSFNEGLLLRCGPEAVRRALYAFARAEVSQPFRLSTAHMRAVFGEGPVWGRAFEAYDAIRYDDLFEDEAAVRLEFERLEGLPPDFMDIRSFLEQVDRTPNDLKAALSDGPRVGERPWAGGSPRPTIARRAAPEARGLPKLLPVLPLSALNEEGRADGLDVQAEFLVAPPCRRVGPGRRAKGSLPCGWTTTGWARRGSR